MANVPMEYTPAAADPQILYVPAPDNTFQRFEIVEAPIMHPDLAAKYSDIKTYRGQGIDDATSTIRLDVTPLGFHAQVLSSSGEWYVDPYYHLDTSVYASYWRTDYVVDQAIANANLTFCSDCGCGSGHSGDVTAELDDDGDCGCGNSLYVEQVFPDQSAISTSEFVGPQYQDFGPAENGGGPPAVEQQLRTYELACAATGEYTAFFGGTVAAGMAAIVTAINRVSGIYETELAVRMELVPNNDVLVFTNSTTDPYTNNNGVTMLGQNQTTCDLLIGTRQL